MTFVDELHEKRIAFIRQNMSEPKYVIIHSSKCDIPKMYIYSHYFSHESDNVSFQGAKLISTESIGEDDIIFVSDTFR